MGLLKGINYDPATAVTKDTTTLRAMTALDTTNLRASFVAPASGKVACRLAGNWNGGAAPLPNMLMGVLEGSTVRFRRPVIWSNVGAVSATIYIGFECFGVIEGLTGGNTYNFDAAYGIETVSGASGAIKYGGPNNATATDAFGAFTFEIWGA